MFVIGYLLMPILVIFPHHSIAMPPISDNELQACIASVIKKNKYTKASEIKKLKCHNKGIRSINGIEALQNLTYLSLFSNKLENVDLTELHNLEYVNISKNKLASVNVRQLERLQTLYLFKNKLTTLDLSGLYSLTKLRVSDNQLISVNTQDLISLEEGHLWNNQMEDFDITPLVKLTFLDVKQNPMPDELYDFFDQQSGITISHDGNADDWK